MAYVVIDSAGEVVTVDAMLDNPETVLPGTIITTGRTPDEAVAKVQELGQEPQKLDGETTTTLTAQRSPSPACSPGLSPKTAAR
jgi:hypothetical protein